MIDALSRGRWRLAVSLKLNALQRIGIVVSVIWLLGFAGYAGYILYNEKQEDALHGRFAELRSECEQYVKDPLNPEAEFDPSISVSKRCFNEARSRFAKNMLAINFGVVVLGWLAVWLAVVITRLVRRRFT
jgi:hypothetical protein